MYNFISVLPTVTALTFVFAIYNGCNYIKNFFIFLHENNPFILNIHDIDDELNKDIDYSYEKKKDSKGFWHFFNFICENNPLILNFNDDSDKTNSDKDNSDKAIELQNNPVAFQQKYEDKYLIKFKQFPNEYCFTDEELKLELQEYERLKIEYEQNRLSIISEIINKLSKIQLILDSYDYINNQDDISESCKKLLLKYYGLENEDQEEKDQEEEDQEEEPNFKNLISSLLTEKTILETDLDKNEQTTLNESELKEKSHEFLLKSKHDKLINNYILEFTPLGNVYMRYNNDKKSFEYFSNNNIPYRYLEAVGRKYVMTYWCKPLFIDIEMELKFAEQKQEEEKHRKVEELKNKSNDVLAKLKIYNKDQKLPINNISVQTKNRGQQNFVLPPQIKANLPNVNQNSGKQLLKENANRYTWEGRLSNFSPLKKINKTVVNKNLVLTFADFKRIQNTK